MAHSAQKPSLSIAHLILLVLALVTSLNAGRSLVHYADVWPFHVDELTYTQAAVNFFRSGNYTSDLYTGNFQPAISTGLAVTWPSAIAWAFNSNLFVSRLVVGGAVWSLYWIVGWLFLRGQALSFPLTIGLIAGVWSLSLFIVPNAPLLLTNMGELIGALWVGLGLLLLRKSPYAAALCWGVAVWFCKFIYSPVVIGFGVSWFMTSPEQWVTRLRRGIVCFCLFLTPFLLWLAIIWLRFDGTAVLSWLQATLGFTAHGQQWLSQSPQVFGLIARLNSPDLEWHSYAWDWKVKILILTLGSITLSTGLLLARSRLVTDRMTGWIILVVIGCISAYTAWYFLWHSFMWIRHLQPALYLGLGLYLFWLRQLAKPLQPLMHRYEWLWLSLAITVVGLQTLNTWQTPLLQAGPTFARTCTDLFSPDCGDYSAIAARIRQTPDGILVRNGPAPPWQAFDDFYGRQQETFVPSDCSDPTGLAMAQQLRKITEGHSEVWLLRTIPVECDPTGFVPRWLAEHTYPAEEFWLQNNLFTRYLITTEVAAQSTQTSRLGDSISLVAWSIDKVTVAPGQALNVALTWLSTDALAQDYRVFVFLANRSEQVATLRDAVPTMWLRPTGTWQPGELITDHHGLLIPPDAGPGDYWLGVGMYNSATGERLPVTTGEGWLNNTALKLTRVTIQKP